ncbi:hypothetical protein [Shigella phage ESh19]|nr:hypothetical protein [Shigella phage ESh19]
MTEGQLQQTNFSISRIEIQKRFGLVIKNCGYRERASHMSH